MPLLHRARARTAGDTGVPAARAASGGAPSGRADSQVPTAGAGPAPVPSTRTSAAWAGVWVAAIILTAFVVFVAQNTDDVRVSFLGLHGTVPLAAGLLIAMVTGILLTLVLGTARIAQVRRAARRRRS